MENINEKFFIMDNQKKTVKYPMGTQGPQNPLHLYFENRHNELVKKISEKQ